MNKSEIKCIFPEFDPGAISFLQVLEPFHEGITITDAQGVILYMNNAQAKIDDFHMADTIGKKVTDLYRVDEGHSPTMACLDKEKPIINLACYYRTHLGRIVNSIHNIYPLTADNRLIGTIGYITNFSNIENTFDMVLQAQPSRAHANGISDKYQNGTRYTFKDIIGKAPFLLTAIQSAELSSESDSPILIYGETGTGKELFAQSIHNKSQRNNRPFLAINCASIPENLLEGLLFGTAKGAFTGAIDKAGLFEKAAGGTLLLDEIDSMPLSLQSKLHRFLQERKVRRIGSMKEMDIDLKIISSINVHPHEAIRSGLLKSDLFYRLAVVLIHIPKLVERKSDLELLISHFLARKNQQMGKDVIGIDREVMEYFENYDWPGNVRELEHVIEGAMNLAGAEKVIKMSHLPTSSLAKIQEPHAPRMAIPLTPDPLNHAGRDTSASSKAGVPTIGTLKEINRQNEMSVIDAALRDTKGNAAKAARNLGISPQMMNYKLKRFKINKKEYE